MSLASEKTTYEHVALDNKGVPYIWGTNMKVIELVIEKKAYGWSPEELYFQHPHPDARSDLFRTGLLLGSSG